MPEVGDGRNVTREINRRTSGLCGSQLLLEPNQDGITILTRMTSRSAIILLIHDHRIESDDPQIRSDLLHIRAKLLEVRHLVRGNERSPNFTQVANVLIVGTHAQSIVGINVVISNRRHQRNANR